MNLKLVKRYILGVALSVGILFNFSGCTVLDKTVYFESSAGRSTVFKIGDRRCSKKEALVYLVNAKNIYGSVDGTNLWTKDFNTDAILSSLKDAVLEHLTKVYVLDIYADENDIVLSEDELKACDNAAEKYFSSLTDAEKAFLNVSKKDICKMYERYYLATKVNTQLMDSVDEEVSEDECRVMEAFVLFVKDESTADDISYMINQGSTFERLAATYTTLDTYHVTFGRKEYPAQVDDVVFNLDCEEISQPIEADGGYYFFQCLDKYNEELSEENKAVIINNRRQKVISDIIKSLEERYYSDINVKLWEDISLEADEAQELLTDSFFEVLSNETGN